MRLPNSSLLALAGLASAAQHHLFVGTFSGAYLYALEFDDETLELSIAANLTAQNAHSWIGFSHDKKALYGVGDGYWHSYSVDNATSAPASSSVVFTGNCSTFHGIYLVAANEAPYNVYGDPFGNCANVLSVDESGALEAVVQNISYYSSSGVHGMAFTPDGKFLYAADDSANSIWTYSVDETTGLLTPVSTIAGPETGSNPRHAAVHPQGTYLYVVLEETNELGQYAIDPETRIPVWENVSYPLIADGLNLTMFWSDEVLVSASGNYLWASSRARNSGDVGYITAFSLSANGSIEEQLFLTNTTTSGGTANAVSPAFFSDEFVALTDTEERFVQIWQFNNETKSAEIVAQVNLDDGGCCANAIWYD